MEESPGPKKRPVLLTLAVVALLVSFIMGKQCGKPAGVSTPSEVSGKGEGVEAAVTSLTAARDGEKIHLVATMKFHTDGRSVQLESPLVRLLTADGREVPRFVAPFLPEPVVAGDAEVPLHWWLSAADAAGALTLEVAGAALALKDSTAFSIDSLPNGQTVSLRFPAWQPLSAASP